MNQPREDRATRVEFLKTESGYLKTESEYLKTESDYLKTEGGLPPSNVETQKSRNTSKHQ